MRRSRDPRQLLDAARTGDRGALARLLSMVEQGGAPAGAIGRLAFRAGGGAYTVGVTGAPGSGKSTLTSELIGCIRRSARRVAVLAVDPSSPFSGGAILGDRVRMQDHALDPDVFIRSMATRGHLGGLALATPEAIRVLDAAGTEVVVVETVGVGQVEVEIAGSADTTLVVVNPGWGDAVQANKAGLLEIADAFVINKADRAGVGETRRDLEQMLDMSDVADWRPPVVNAVATTGDGVAEVWDAVERHRAHLEDGGRLERRRADRLVREVRDIVVARVEERASEALRGSALDELRDALVERRTDPYSAADEVIAGLSL